VTEAEYRTRILRLVRAAAPRLERVLQSLYGAILRQAPASEIVAILERHGADSRLIVKLLRLERVPQLLSPQGRTRIAVAREVMELASRHLRAETGTRIPKDLASSAVRRLTAARLEVLAGEVVDHASRAVKVAVDQLELLGPRETAVQVRVSVAQSERYAQAVARYRVELLEADVPAARARKLAAEYAENLKRRRLGVMARDHAMSSARDTEAATWRDAAARGHLDPDEWEREWVAILHDGRVCRICYKAHGTRAPIGGAFPNGSLVAEGHPVGCRCQERLVEKGSKRPKRPAWVEPRYGSLRPVTPAEAAAGAD